MMSAEALAAKQLFIECFDTDEKETEIIVGFAKNHGKIHLKRFGNEIANLICVCEITDGDFFADYLFGCCTKKDFRNKGLFKSHLFEVIGDKSAVLIPENENLFAFYEGLGFSEITHLEVMTNAFDGAKVSNLSAEELFSVYKKSDIFPKKDFQTFSATLCAFLHYGGAVKEKDGVFATVIDGKITEIYSESKEKTLSLLKTSFEGNQKLLLPQTYEEALSENKIKFTKKAIAMAKNISPSLMKKIYVNNLFN